MRLLQELYNSIRDLASGKLEYAEQWITMFRRWGSAISISPAITADMMFRLDLQQFGHALLLVWSLLAQLWLSMMILKMIYQLSKKVSNAIISIPRLPERLIGHFTDLIIEELYTPDETEEADNTTTQSTAETYTKIITDLDDVLRRLVQINPRAEAEVISAMTKAHFVYAGVVTLYTLRTFTLNRAGVHMPDELNKRCVARPCEAHPCYKNLYVHRGRLHMLTRERVQCLICHQPILDHELATFHGSCGQSLHLYCAQNWHLRGRATCPFDNQPLVKTEF